MKSKITKIQEILTKGITIALVGMFSFTPITFAATSLDDSYLEGSFLDKILYGTIGSTAKEIEEYLVGHTTLYISNEIQLRALAEYVNSGNNCYEKEIRLLNDIIVDSSQEWVPIGNISHPFKGRFDGKGYTISGINFNRNNKLYSEISYVGLFGCLNEATIKNITLSNSKFNIPYDVSNDIESYDGNFHGKYKVLGGIAGSNTAGTIENCTIKDDVEIIGLDYVGGIVGSNNYGTILNCSNDGFISGMGAVAGIAGGNYGDIDTNIKKRNEKNEEILDFSNNAVAKIINCTNEENANIQVLIGPAGGIVGSSRDNTIIQKSKNHGSISHITTKKVNINVYGEMVEYNPQNIGGIAGIISGGTKTENDTLSYNGYVAIDGCVNYFDAKVKGYIDVGGIVGQLGGAAGGYAILSDCINYSTDIKVLTEGKEDEERKTERGYLAGQLDNEDAYLILNNNLYFMEEYSSDEFNEHPTAYGGFSSTNKIENKYVNINETGTKIITKEDSNNKIYSDSSSSTTMKGYDLSKHNSICTEANNKSENTKLLGNNISAYVNNDKIYKYDESIDTINLKQDSDNEQILDSKTGTTVKYEIYKNNGTSPINGNTYFKLGDEIKIVATFNKYLASTYGPLNKISIAPRLKLNSSIEMVAGTISANSSKYTTTIPYKYTVQSGDNLSIEDINLSISGTIYAISGNDYSTNHPTINSSGLQTKVKGLYIDTISPVINTKVYVENALETGRYTAGKEVLIEITTSEAIQGTDAPRIQVSFSKSGVGKYNYDAKTETVGYAKCKDAKINVAGTTTWSYLYQIQEGDEGDLQLEYKSGTIIDLAGNETDIKALYTPSTEKPSRPITGAEWSNDLGVTYEFYKNSVSEENKITSQTYFTDEEDLIVVAKFDKVLYVHYGLSDGKNTNVRLNNTYKNRAPSIYLNGDSTLKQSTIEKVTTTDYVEATSTQGTTTVQYRFTDIAKNYDLKNLTQIEKVLLKNENNIENVSINGTSAATNGLIPYAEKWYSIYKTEDEEQYNKTTLTSEKIKTTEGLDDIIIDPIGVSTKIEKSDIYADTTSPTVEITANKENPTNTDKLEYTFKFSEVVEGFTADDITVNNGIKVTETVGEGEEAREEVKFKEVKKGLEYTLEVNPTIPAGNEGILQVIVEEGACTDLVSINNVRQENNITIDKVKPTFTSYEVKQETGKIIIEATFSEELLDASGLIPTLTVGKNASRGSWEDVEIYDNNKARYVYNVSGADGGKVEASLAGTVKDKAGNDSETLNITIENDITIEQTVIKNGKDTYSFKKGNTPISDFTKPTYFVKNNTITVTKDTETEIDVDGERQVKIVTTNYTYTIAEDIDLTYMKYMNLTEPVEGETTGTVAFSETGKTGSINISEANIYFDTIAPKVTTQITANNPIQNNIYKLGEEFTIKATTSEAIQDEYIIPEINVKFGEKAGQFNNGKAEYLESIQNENGTTTWVYRYRVSEGDEGAVSLEYASGRIKDLAGNTVRNIATLNQEENIFVLNSIVVDTIIPTVKVDVKKVVENTKTEIANNITNADKLEYTFTWSEEVTGFEPKDITVNNGNNVTFVQSKIDKKVYTMTVDTTVETGNVGDIQVIIEQNACQDIVGHGNVRTESVIRVDKQAPILLSLEAYANNTDSSIKVDENIDTVKEYYKEGDTVTVVATFSENIENTTKVPILALQFSESGNAKGTISTGEKSGNKITYTYTITAEDMGTLSVKGFSGTALDAAGNETIVTKRNLNGDTIIADTKSPTLVGITAISPNFEYDELLQDGETKRYGIQSKTRTENTITIIAEYSENVYNLSSNTINKITDTTDPVLKLKFGTGTTRTAKYYKTEGSKIYYTYNIASGDNGDLSIVSLSGTVSDIAGNTCTTSTSLPTLVKYEESIAEENKVNNITADTKNSTFTITATAVNYDDNKNVITGNNGSYYRKGSIITVTAKTNEYVYKNSNKELTRFAENGSDAPQLNISFSTNGNGVGTCANVEYVNNQTIFTYTYEVKENDNGTLNLNIAASQGYDIALNGNNVKTQSISNIIADTVNPVTNWQSWVESEQYGIVDNQNGTWTVTFSEILYVYDSANHKVGNQLTNSNKTSAPILLVSSDNQTALETTISNITTSGNKTVITYTYSPYTRNIGVYGMKFANVSDKAGNLFNYKDQKAPTLSSIEVTEPISGTYKAGQEITIVATFSEKVTGIAPTLALQFSESGDAKGNVSNGVIAENTITYTYTIKDGDNGKLSIKSFTGTGLKDLSDNLWVAPTSVTLTGNEIIADTIAPTLTITSDVERTNKDVVTYTFTWSEKVTGFTVEDIEVTNGLKGTFTGENGRNVYTLEVDTTNEGRQIVKVNANVCTDIAGNANAQRATYNQVVIDYTQPEVRAKVNGGNYVLDNTDPENKKSTLKETIVVDEELSSMQYVWSSSETIPEAGWVSEDVSTILVNSDMNLTKEVKETGTYYLYIKAIDIAGNTLEAKTKAFVVKTSQITLTQDKTEITNQDVTVTVEYGEGLTENRKAGVSGLTQSADSNKVVIAENGTVYAEATDKAGNKVCKVLEIENIDKIAPEGTITYVTNEDKSVTATISFNEENVTITNNNGKNDYVFEENGKFTFEFRDVAGNINKATAVVTSIDKTAPEATINYITNEDGSITAKISFNEETVITNNEGKDTYVFTKNGEFTFEFKDLAGNTGTAVAKVTTIKEQDEPVSPPVEEDKTAPEITFNYTTTTSTVGTIIGATITTNEDAIISYSWDNKTWISTEDYVRNINVKKNPTTAGTYTLYAKAIDKASNTSSVSTLAFTVVKSDEDIVRPEIIFEDLTTIQKDGIKYVKVTQSYTTDNLRTKMDENALLGKVPEYTKLTSDKKLKTGSEITIDGDTKYIIIVNGDVNCDGKVDFLNDIVMINNYRIGINKNLSDIQILAGDINNSGTIDFIPDIVAMNNYRLGRIKVL